MSPWILPALCLAPLIAATVAARPAARWVAALGALTALAAALALPAGTGWGASWLLLGTRIGVDAASRWMLVLSAALWLVAALQTALTQGDDPRAGRLRLFMLLAMAGNFLLLVGQDLVSFYLGFVVMGLAVYGLISHRGDPAAVRAGRVYMVLEVIAQIALFESLLLIAWHAGTLTPAPEQLVGLGAMATALMLLGFGIKAGLIGAHVWVALAARSAPAPAAAVALGAFVMAAAIGWTRFLPIGHEALVDWGTALTAVGVATTLYALIVGLLQADPRAVLGYASVGLSGVLAMLLAVALTEPARAAAAMDALTLFAGAQALSIGAMFLGAGVARRVPGVWVIAILALPALVLAGAPYTWGAMAQGLAGELLLGTDASGSQTLRLVILGAWLGTSLLMVRFLVLVRTAHTGSTGTGFGAAVPWLGLVLLILVMPLLIAGPFPPLSQSWPLLAGVLLALPLALIHPRWVANLIGRVHAGDLLNPLGRAVSAVWAWVRRALPSDALAAPRAAFGRLRERLLIGRAASNPVERALALWPVAGALFLGIGLALFLLLAR